MMTTTYTTDEPNHPRVSSSILGRLRTLIPVREHVTFGEALSIAERQAAALCTALDPDNDGLNENHLSRLPRIAIRRTSLPVSGLSHWDGHAWVITLNGSDSLTRQRFTLLHEFKHIVDHGNAHRLYRGSPSREASEQAELAADYFAGCALVSKRHLKSAWGNGLQRPAVLAEHFGVSEQAIRVRLAQTGLDRPRDGLPAPRCARPVHTPPEMRQQFRTARTWRDR